MQAKSNKRMNVTRTPKRVAVMMTALGLISGFLYLSSANTETLSALENMKPNTVFRAPEFNWKSVNDGMSYDDDHASGTFDSDGLREVLWPPVLDTMGTGKYDAEIRKRLSMASNGNGQFAFELLMLEHSCEKLFSSLDRDSRRRCQDLTSQRDYLVSILLAHRTNDPEDFYSLYMGQQKGQRMGLQSSLLD